MRGHSLSLTLAWLGGSILTAALLLALRAQADGDLTSNAVPRHIPYRGVLELDGASYNGDIDMEFRIFASETATTAAWTEIQTVTVIDGKFMVLLGSTSGTSLNGLDDALSVADDVHLDVVIKAADGDKQMQTKSTGRKRFVPVPYAAWTSTSTTFDVASQLTINANLVATMIGTDKGPLEIEDGGVPDMFLDGDDVASTNILWINRDSKQIVQFNGPLDIDDDHISAWNGTSSGVTDHGNMVSHMSGNQLRIDPDTNGVNTTTRIESDVTFEENVSGLTATVDISSGCTTIDTTTFTDTRWVDCPSNTAIAGIGIYEFSGPPFAGLKLISSVECCPLNLTVQ